MRIDSPHPSYITSWKVFRRLSDEASTTSMHVLSLLKRASFEPLQIVDVGCGDAKILADVLLKARWASIPDSVTLIDPNAEFLEEARIEIMPVFKNSISICPKSVAEADLQIPPRTLTLMIHMVYLITWEEIDKILKLMSAGSIVIIVLDSEDSILTRIWRRTAPKYQRRAAEYRKRIELLASPFSWTRTTITSWLKNPIELQEEMMEAALSLLAYTDVRDLPQEEQCWIQQQVLSHLAEGRLACESACYEIKKTEPGPI